MDSILLNFVGDISLNGQYNEVLANKGPNFPFEQVKSIFAESDIVMGNLESPFVSQDRKPQFKMKTPLRADSDYAEGLKWAGFDILCLSNNHVLDYGQMGVHTTQEVLTKQNIRYFGYGENIYSAKEFKIISVNSIKIGFVGYTDVIIDSPFYASDTNGGIAKFDIDSAIKDTRHNKKIVDFLVINLHWGIEYFHLPSPEQIENARKLIDAGADIIIGHHPHTLQGIERYGDGIIAYSLGNFVFADIKWNWVTENKEKRTTYYRFSRSQRESIILKVAISDQGSLNYDVIGSYVSKSGQIIKSESATKRLYHLSRLLRRQDYPEYFREQLRFFHVKKFFSQSLSRGKRFYKIRPKHFAELWSYLYKKNLSR